MEWFFIVYHNAEGHPAEYECHRCKPDFLADRMENYLKFTAHSREGVAYRISPETGKPNFRTEAMRSRLPF